MSKDEQIKKAKEIASICSQIEDIEKKIDFATRSYMDEFYLAYGEEFSEHMSKTELLPRDLEVLKEYWNLQKTRLEDELAELLK